MQTSLTIFVTVFAGLFGLAIGSFLNVVAYRLPRRISLLRESRCANCRSRIRWYQNIPVVSWLALGGRCAVCWDRIPVRDLLVEIGTGVLFAAVALGVTVSRPFDARPVDGPQWFGTPEYWGVLLTLEVFAALTVVLTLIDLDTKRLPNAIVLPGWATVVALILLTTIATVLMPQPVPEASAMAGPSGAGTPAAGIELWMPLLRALIGGASLFLFYFLVRAISPRGMGGGDVKLAGLAGTVLGWFGWGELLVGAFSAFLLGGVFGVVLIALGRAKRKTAIPFGPWILAGAWVGLVAGAPLSTWYLSLYS
ncbi:type 4 prepilin-like proteins leader peptide-processing enzyme [Microbacterium sp. HM58-2]|nr:type 4 prepilin-like proteins leader peptide-processing enzyme [Microbacterium sp. HM58-2]